MSPSSQDSRARLTPAHLKIQQFADYRAFLLAHTQDMKRLRARWSYGVWAKALGLKATSSITKIVHGQREPGPEITERLIRYFRFTDAQAQYFRDLVRLKKMNNDPRLKVLLMEKLARQQQGRATRLLDDQVFAVISNWYHLALRELTRLPGFREDMKWIASRFLQRLTSREVKAAMLTLSETGLLRRDARGRLVPDDVRLDTTNDVASEAIKRYHEQMLGHARSSLREVPTEDREISSLSLAMSSRDLSAAKELIRKFKADFERLFDSDSGDRIYQFQIQLFPLTRHVEPKH